MSELAFQVYTRNHGAGVGASNFREIIKLLEKDRELLPRKKRDVDLTSEAILTDFAKKHFRGRQINKPALSNSPKDPIILLIAGRYFKVPTSEYDKFYDYHKQAMGVENVVGSYIEAYLDSKLQKLGWVWCAGSIVDKVDFFKVDSKCTLLLQVKSRSNTENSSSSTVRDGTTIKKWFRFYADTGVTAWGEFPDKAAAKFLSEEEFRDFVIKILTS
ncbi:MAG: SinI family restriction endonuclease [Verrucomicrobiota bacterium]|jgi:SinI restriction endonuclease